MSIAGKRAGLDGERSVLFYEAIRIIKEMRCATNGRYPKYAVWENVPGAFSSNSGADFKAVLDALIQIVRPEAGVPAPADGKWPYADVYLGNGWSLAYRTIDAQYFGVAQRRRRVYAVASFANERAADILFERQSVSRHFTPGFCAREETAGDAGAGAAPPVTLNERQYALTVGERAANTLTGTDYKGAQCVFEPKPKALKIRSGCEGGGKGALVQDDMSATLGCNNDQTVFVPTAYGICSDKSNAMLSDNPNSGIYEADTSRTLDANGGNPGCNQGGVAIVEPVAFAQNQRSEVRDLKGLAGAISAYPGMKQQTYVAAFKYGNSAKAYGIGYEEEKSPTLAGAPGGNQTPVVCVQSDSVHIDDLHTVALDCRNMTANDDISGTLQAKNNGGHSDNYLNPVCYSIDRAAMHQGVNAKFRIGVSEEKTHTLIAEGPGAVAQPYQRIAGTLAAGAHSSGFNGQDAYNDRLIPVANGAEYIVRRLTPTECARLQGFPDWWCADLDTPEPTEDDIAFWSEVWETHRRIMGTSTKSKTRKQIIKWLRAPHSDSSEYKMWGNGVALPCVCFVLAGIAEQAQKT